jgi:hypothetical protein
MARFRIGSIPYVDSNEEDKTRAGKSRDVILWRREDGFALEVEGSSTDRVIPPQTYDADQAIRLTQRWIQENRGSCLGNLNFIDFRKAKVEPRQRYRNRD